MDRLDESRKLIIAYDDITNDAKTFDQINQICEYLNISPTEKQRMNAFNYIRKSSRK